MFRMFCCLFFFSARFTYILSVVSPFSLSHLQLLLLCEHREELNERHGYKSTIIFKQNRFERNKQQKTTSKIRTRSDPWENNGELHGMRAYENKKNKNSRKKNKKRDLNGAGEKNAKKKGKHYVCIPFGALLFSLNSQNFPYNIEMLSKFFDKFEIQHTQVASRAMNTHQYSNLFKQKIKWATTEWIYKLKNKFKEQHTCTALHSTTQAYRPNSKWSQF